MSFKVGWDQADDPLYIRCEVIAGWLGYALAATGRHWSLVPVDDPSGQPAATGTLEEIEAVLIAVRASEPDPHRGRRRPPATRQLAAELQRAAMLAVTAQRQGLLLRPHEGGWTLSAATSAREGPGAIALDGERLRLPDGRVVPITMSLDQVDALVRDGDDAR
jgi:hypothetical protein